MAEFRGNLYIFVDVATEESPTQPTRKFDDIFGLCEPGTMRWYLSGWAVGNSPKYCSRTSASKLRRFATFTEAMDVVRKRRKARPREQFHLVYELDGRKTVVTGLDQILRLDSGVAGIESPERPDSDNTTTHEALASKVGSIVATNAMLLLRILEKEGAAAARLRFSGATYARLWQVLHEANLLVGIPVDPAWSSAALDPSSCGGFQAF